jgi:hypothetical protein
MVTAGKINIGCASVFKKKNLEYTDSHRSERTSKTDGKCDEFVHFKWIF